MTSKRWWLVWQQGDLWQALEFENAGSARVFKEQMGHKTATVIAAASKNLALEAVRGKNREVGEKGL